MKKFYFLLCFLFAGWAVNGQSILAKEYYFPHIDIEVDKLSQSNDTLFEHKCYTERPCNENPRRYYKIWDLIVRKNKYIYKLERLDTLSFANKPHPERKYAILVLKQPDSNRIQVLYQVSGLSKKDITSEFVDSFTVTNKFGFTYFSKSYYEEMSTWKKLSTQAQVNEIMILTKAKTHKRLGKLYKTSHPPDMYAARLSAEILNRVCIEKKFNPFGAGGILTKITRDTQKTGSF